jgi:hypothetical protein
MKLCRVVLKVRSLVRGRGVVLEGEEVACLLFLFAVLVGLGEVRRRLG